MILTVCANPSVDSFWSIDQINKGTTNRSNKEVFYPGGKGIHIAFALNELGKDITTLGVWGGQTGDWLKQECIKNGIAAIGPSVEQWTRLCITVQSSTDWNETEFLGGGPEVETYKGENFITLYQKYIQEKQPNAVVISGSVPKGFDNDVYYNLISIANHFKVPSFLDTSGPLLQHSLEAKPYSVHINQHEGEELCGTDNPIEVARWLSGSCVVPAVTAGADGLYLLVDDHIYHASCHIDPPRIISTVGSGDCLLAGLCLTTLDHEDPFYWARYATACGSANCISPELGMLKSADVSDLLRHVTLKEMKV